MPYRQYDQNIIFLLPPSLDEWITKDHPVRVFSDILERIDIGGFREAKVEGRPAYHPRMMLKILFMGICKRNTIKPEDRIKTSKRCSVYVVGSVGEAGLSDNMFISHSE